jgi:hypothetical protein
MGVGARCASSSIGYWHPGVNRRYVASSVRTSRRSNPVVAAAKDGDLRAVRALIAKGAKTTRPGWVHRAPVAAYQPRHDAGAARGRREVDARTNAASHRSSSQFPGDAPVMGALLAGAKARTQRRRVTAADGRFEDRPPRCRAARGGLE